jgi:hypothetical protein
LGDNREGRDVERSSSARDIKILNFQCVEVCPHINSSSYKNLKVKMDFRKERDRSLDARDMRFILFFYYLKCTTAVSYSNECLKKLVAAAATAGSVFMMAMTLFRA